MKPIPAYRVISWLLFPMIHPHGQTYAMLNAEREDPQRRTGIAAVVNVTSVDLPGQVYTDEAKCGLRSSSGGGRVVTREAKCPLDALSQREWSSRKSVA
jgi:hypothetical protein